MTRRGRLLLGTVILSMHLQQRYEGGLFLDPPRSLAFFDLSTH